MVYLPRCVSMAYLEIRGAAQHSFLFAALYNEIKLDFGIVFSYRHFIIINTKVFIPNRAP